MEDIDLGTDSHAHEKQPLTSTPPTPPYTQYQQQQHQWHPRTPNMGSPLASPPLTNTPPARRATGEFSRQWKSPPTSGGGLLSSRVSSARTSSETIRPPSRSSISSLSQGETALPRKYIGPEMNKVLHRHRLSESGIVLGQSEEESIGRRGRFWSFLGWGKTASSTSLLRWIPEVGSIAASAVLLIAIATVLKSYDGRPQPDWPGPFNLHCVVAFLAVLAQAGYLAPVVQGLGQLCWLRYSGGGGHNYVISKPLRDFEMIDRATRGGIHGSFGLLFGYKKGGVLGILGAFIIITSVFTTPMTQGLISYTAELTPGDGLGGLADAGPGGNTTAATYNGTPYTNQSMVHIHWEYLTPLLVQIILSAVFLAPVVILTRREGIQIIKTSSLATMVALRDDFADGLGDGTLGVMSHGTSGIGSIANLAELNRKSSTLRVRLEKDALSGLALGLAPVHGGEDQQRLMDEGLGSRKEDLESRLTAGPQMRTRISSARDRRRNMNRNTRIIGGVVQ